MSDENAPRIGDCLERMIEAAEQACVYIEGLNKVDFVADKRTQQAVILNLILIGEEATKLLKDHAVFVDQHPGIPWHSMKGMRNRIAHGYHEINLDTVWETLQTALPNLMSQLPPVLRSRVRRRQR